MQQSDYEIVGKFGFESRTHRFFERYCKQEKTGALVQLVRIHACHAWGHGFESRTHRQFTKKN